MIAIVFNSYNDAVKGLSTARKITSIDTGKEGLENKLFIVDPSELAKFDEEGINYQMGSVDETKYPTAALGKLLHYSTP